MKRRVCAFFTSVLTLVIIMILTVSAGAFENAGIDAAKLSRSFYKVNPLYQDVIDTDDLNVHEIVNLISLHKSNI